MAWEKYTRPDGRKDVRVVGAPPGTMYDPRQKQVAKARIVASEKASAEMRAAGALRAQVQRELAAKAAAKAGVKPVSVRPGPGVSSRSRPKG